jgi:hypothetical protein
MIRSATSSAVAASAALALSGCGPARSADEQLLDRGLDYVRQPNMIPHDAVIEHAFLSRWTDRGRTLNAVCGSYATMGQRIAFVRPSAEDNHPVGLQNAGVANRGAIPEWDRWCGHPVADGAGRPVEYRPEAPR